jgi:hypothetical protein
VRALEKEIAELRTFKLRAVGRLREARRLLESLEEEGSSVTFRIEAPCDGTCDFRGVPWKRTPREKVTTGIHGAKFWGLKRSPDPV